MLAGGLLAPSGSINVLDQKLFQVVRPLHVDVRRAILSAIWKHDSSKEGSDDKTHSYDSYFRHYEDACEQLPSEGISQLAHRQLLDVVGLIVDQKKKVCRREVRSLLPQEFDTLIDNVIVFAAHALLLLDISRWPDEQYLRDFVRSQFHGLPSTSERSRLPRNFNFKSMNEIAGIQPNWTPDLLQHLHVRHNNEGGAYVAVFHHVAVLDLYKNSKQ
jgi:hypothetical protein